MRTTRLTTPILTRLCVSPHTHEGSESSNEAMSVLLGHTHFPIYCYWKQLSKRSLPNHTTVSSHLSRIRLFSTHFLLIIKATAGLSRSKLSDILDPASLKGSAAFVFSHLGWLVVHTSLSFQVSFSSGSWLSILSATTRTHFHLLDLSQFLLYYLLTNFSCLTAAFLVSSGLRHLLILWGLSQMARLFCNLICVGISR